MKKKNKLKRFIGYAIGWSLVIAILSGSIGLAIKSVRWVISML